MAEHQDSSEAEKLFVERRRLAGREKYRRALEKDPGYNKKKYQRQNEKRRLGLLPPLKRRKQRKCYRRPTELSRQRDRRKYAKNKSKIVRRVVRRQRERYATDKEYAACQSLRSRMQYAIRSQSTKKTARTIELLGCTAKELVCHIESQFVEGMSWGNRREWHIDHIIPVSAFDLTAQEGQRAAFHYTNLRPLWARDNRVKSAKPPVMQRRFCFGYVTLADERRAEARKGGQVTERGRA